MSVMVLLAGLSLLADATQGPVGLPAGMASKTADAGPMWPRRDFGLVKYCEAIGGVVASRESWETGKYKGTYDSVLGLAAINLTSFLEDSVQASWRVPLEQIRTGIRLVPARLQKDPKAFDIIYCTYESQGRQVLLTRFGRDASARMGVSFSLTPDERALLEQPELKAVEKWANQRLQGFLVPDSLAPYRLELSRMSASDRVELRGRQAFRGGVTVEDSDKRPTHYRSAIAGYLDDKALTVVMWTRPYYYDPEEKVYLHPGVPAQFVPWNEVFDEMIRVSRPSVPEEP